MRNNRWDEFKERRLVAYKNYLDVIKKIKMIKNFIIHAKLLQIFKVLITVFNKAVLKQKHKMAMTFIAIKMFIKFRLNGRKYAVDKWGDVGGYEALMMKHKNTIKYAFTLPVITYTSGFQALKFDANKSHRSLVNYGRDLL